jgi:hypothetical protein
MRIPAAAAAIAALSLLAPASPALAWGSEGHRAVAAVAVQMLTGPARQQAERLLAADADGARTWDAAAVWADQWRAAHRETAPWHFARGDVSKPDLDLAAACRKSCVVKGVRQFAEQLADGSQPQQERIRALKFLVHLVGDLHQPLHVAGDGDGGGNDVQVSFLGRRNLNLHHVWDDEILERARKASGRAAASLVLDAVERERIAEWARGTPEDWARESFVLSRSVAYGALPKGPQPYALDERYQAAAWPVVREQLARAAVRLASLLNAALR